MAESGDSSLAFFTKAAPNQWSYVLSLYKDVLSLKAALRTKKGGPEELIRLDTWYQEQLPKQIHARKDPLLTHEELVQIMKWKLMRGKFRPRLIDLVKINTERAVKEATKKAFKKIPNISSAISALTTLKGIGPATASAVLAAGFPEHAPYMADESMLATPGIEATDYTLVEYLNYAEQIQACCKRLQKRDPEAKWTPHKVELTLWTHYIARDMKPALLDSMPAPVLKDNSESDSENSQDGPPVQAPTTPNGNSQGHKDKEGSNGAGPKAKILNDEAESSNSSLDKIEASDESSQDSSSTKAPPIIKSVDNNNSDELQEPPNKKICV